MQRYIGLTVVAYGSANSDLYTQVVLIQRCIGTAEVIYLDQHTYIVVYQQVVLVYRCIVLETDFSVE